MKRNKNKYAIYQIHQVVTFHDGRVKRYNIKFKEDVKVPDIDEFRKEYLRNLRECSKFKDCEISINLSYYNLSDEILN